jgi:Serine/Threonine/Tyrosine Kinase found in polyvalent proteins
MKSEKRQWPTLEGRLSQPLTSRVEAVRQLQITMPITPLARRTAAEQRRLIQWAEENGKLGSSGRLPPVFAQGGEHKVFFQRRTQRYLKATRQDRHKGYGIALGSHTHGATPSEYLDRLSLQNCIFNDDIRLDRVVRNDGKPIIIISQPAIKGCVPPQEELDELMIVKGYEKLAEGAYYDEKEGLLFYDLFPRNAIRAADGHVYPIDPVIQRITRDFGQFLRHEPYTINLPH